MHRIPSNENRVRSQAAACFFPPTDFLNYGGPGIDGVGAGPLAPLKAAFTSHALGPAERLQLGREISPIYFVTAQLPPTLIIHGDADTVVPLQQSETFLARAKAAGSAGRRIGHPSWQRPRLGRLLAFPA